MRKIDFCKSFKSILFSRKGDLETKTEKCKFRQKEGSLGHACKFKRILKKFKGNIKSHDFKTTYPKEEKVVKIEKF